MNATDMLCLEDEVKEVMDHVKKMDDKLSNRKTSYNDTAELNPEENKKYLNSDTNLKDSLAQIGKMKVILETKVAEERKAKLCRMQSEEESRNILLSLTYDEVSSAFKNNFREFLNLLNESGKINDDTEKSVHPVEKEAGIPERDKSQSCMKSVKFIERNIQLAQCGKGVLSLTDKEKLRIQNLMEEDEENYWLNKDLGESLKDVFNKNCKKFYGLDEDSKFLLMCVDEKLEAFPRQIHLNTFESRQSSAEEETEPYKDNGNVKDNNDTIDANKSKRRVKNERRNLKKIEKLLNDLNSITDEEISPLSSEEMELLIRQARQNLQDTVVKGFEERYKNNDIKEPELNEKFKLISSNDLIANLVHNAKCLMPKFKFRYDVS